MFNRRFDLMQQPGYGLLFRERRKGNGRKLTPWRDTVRYVLTDGPLRSFHRLFRSQALPNRAEFAAPYHPASNRSTAFLSSAAQSGPQTLVGDGDLATIVSHVDILTGDYSSIVSSEGRLASRLLAGNGAWAIQHRNLAIRRPSRLPLDAGLYEGRSDAINRVKPRIYPSHNCRC